MKIVLSLVLVACLVSISPAGILKPRQRPVQNVLREKPTQKPCQRAVRNVLREKQCRRVLKRLRCRCE